MKILFISSRLPHAEVISGHQIVYQRIRRLSARGHEIGLAVLGSEDDSEHIPEVRKIVSELEVRPRPAPVFLLTRALRNVFSRIPPRFRPVYSPELFKCVGDMVEKSRYDVVVAEFGLMGQYLNRNPYMPAVRKVISVHHCHTISSRQSVDLLGYSPRAIPEWFAYRRLRDFEFEMFRCADHVLVLTPEERYSILNDAPDLRMTVVPSGVDTTVFEPEPNANREEALLFTGYYNDQPNRDAVMWFCNTVWRKLKKKRPDLVFYVVGPDPSHAMRELARKDPSIIVTGWVEDIRPYLAKAKVFVCPNRLGSGMRGKVLQAMASGVPVVATTLGAEGIPIQMGNNGFLADKPAIIAQYIDLLLSDPVLHRGIAERAREMVVERFSWERSIDVFEKILSDVIAGR